MNSNPVFTTKSLVLFPLTTLIIAGMKVGPSLENDHPNLLLELAVTDVGKSSDAFDISKMSDPGATPGEVDKSVSSKIYDPKNDPKSGQASGKVFDPPPVAPTSVSGKTASVAPPPKGGGGIQDKVLVHPEAHSPDESGATVTSHIVPAGPFDGTNPLAPNVDAHTISVSSSYPERIAHDAPAVGGRAYADVPAVGSQSPSFPPVAAPALEPGPTAIEAGATVLVVAIETRNSDTDAWRPCGEFAPATDVGAERKGFYGLGRFVRAVAKTSGAHVNVAFSVGELR